MTEIIDEYDYGWIRIDQNIKYHWIWQDPIKLRWWLDILFTANHKEGKVNLGLQLFECNRGQIVMSLSSWAKRWGVSKNIVRRFFILLENEGMIIYKTVSIYTQLTVCNYESYIETRNGCETVAKRLTNEKKNENDSKSENTEPKIDVYSFDEFWDDYAKKVGDKDKLRNKWSKLSQADKLKIKEYIPKYKKAQPDKKYRKNPETFLNNKSWYDEIISAETSEQPTKRYRDLSSELFDM